ncbi:MAG: heme A synthase [Methylococcales bacterium]|jgi:heme a synthase|nr:heme A synthase [Methylococcales bacterium]MBT7409022.1 heme A synthase [Methylococcales bacterium]
MSNVSENTQCYKAMSVWLLICCFMIFSMVVLGGLTRLTGSGLSMVEWEPLMGIVPPLNQEQWVDVYEKYQQSPEYQKINHNMGLNAFKQIFWFEYSHRVLGRLIGMVFLIPFLIFSLKRCVPKKLIPQFIIMFVLGGLQGLLGWYMVKSGLVNNPHVSQYRLTAHLSAALLIYAYIFWIALDLIKVNTELKITRELTHLRRFIVFIGFILLVTIMSGGLVAGLKAGHSYNTFPLMAGQWIPDAILQLQPWWLNVLENGATVQFDHRVLAIASFCLVIGFVLYSKKYELNQRTTTAINLMALMVVIQVGLGISTLLLRVPIVLASAHQAGAVILFTITLYVIHDLIKYHHCD